MRKEDALSLQVATYLQLQYPNIIYHFDLSSGGTTSIGMAIRNKRINKCLGYPDLFIAHPHKEWFGLFIEIKVDSPFKKNGELKSSEHLREQFEMLIKLTNNGYYACFGVGFDNIKEIIDNYLNEK